MATDCPGLLIVLTLNIHELAPTRHSEDGRANELLGPEATFLRDAKTKPEFSLYEIDWYPGLTEAGSTAVAGEVWEINPQQWEKLDEYEGVPDDYLRKTITLEDGMLVQTYIYIGETKPARLIVGGDWVTR